MPNYFRFHVQLQGVRSPLWRRFLVLAPASFLDLHEAIQDACGWQDCHLFAFRKADGRTAIAGIPDDHGWSDSEPDPDAAVVGLSSYFEAGKRDTCIYVYDFGDDWWHDVELEGVEEHEQLFERRLLAGEGTFPPEDCGGLPGYEQCVAAATGAWGKKYGSKSELRERLEWLDGWKPDSFDLAAAQRDFAQERNDAAG